MPAYEYKREDGTIFDIIQKMSNSDESVPHSETELLFRRSPPEEKEIRLIDNAGYTFQISHPFNEDDFLQEFSEAPDVTEGWFPDHLKLLFMRFTCLVK